MNQTESTIARVKGILFSPTNEWKIIAKEDKSPALVFKGYLLPLSVISVITCYIGYGIVGSNQGMFGLVATAELGYRYAAFSFFNLITGPFITAFIIAIIASFFNTKRSYNRTFRLVAYSYTPALVASLFYIVPVLSPIVILAGLYGLYLFYLGLKPMTNVPDENKTPFLAVSILTTMVVYFVISIIMASIFIH
jgi:hypothetical protein